MKGLIMKNKIKGFASSRPVLFSTIIVFLFISFIAINSSVLIYYKIDLIRNNFYFGPDFVDSIFLLVTSVFFIYLMKTTEISKFHDFQRCNGLSILKKLMFYLLAIVIFYISIFETLFLPTILFALICLMLIKDILNSPDFSWRNLLEGLKSSWFCLVLATIFYILDRIYVPSDFIVTEDLVRNNLQNINSFLFTQLQVLIMQGLILKNLHEKFGTNHKGTAKAILISEIMYVIFIIAYLRNIIDLKYILIYVFCRIMAFVFISALYLRFKTILVPIIVCGLNEYLYTTSILNLSPPPQISENTVHFNIVISIVFLIIGLIILRKLNYEKPKTSITTT